MTNLLNPFRMAAPGGGGLSIQSQARLINTSAPGVTPTILSSITMSAGDMLVIVMATCRNTGSSAMTIFGTWNGENLTESENILHAGGRITAHILTLAAASSGTFSPVITCSNSAAAVGAYFYVVRGQSGTPIKQTKTASLTSSAGPVQATIVAPNTGALIFATGSVRFATGGATVMNANAPLAQDDTFQTGTGNNLDLAFGAGHMTAPSTSDITIGFTPDATQNLLIAAVEIF
jgi:hypothetical protein